MAARRHRVRVRVPQGAALVGGFSNPVVGGDGELVRDRIKSDNYVAGTSGWDVEKTGQAEFQDVTARGDITATSVLVGDLPDPQVSIHSTAHLGVVEFLMNDSLGLLQSAKFNGVVNSDGAANEQAYLELAAPFFSPGVGNPGNGQAVIDLTSASHDGFADANINLHCFKDGTTRPATQVTPNGIKVGAGFEGAYCYEEVELSGAQVIPTGAAFNQLTTFLANHTATDYPSAFTPSTGVWTCPISGVYSFTMSAMFTAWVSGSRLLAAMARNGAATANFFAARDALDNSGKVLLNARKFFAVNDVVRFYVGQVTAANQSLAFGEQSYISVQREI